jgi:hypothetical protein
VKVINIGRLFFNNYKQTNKHSETQLVTPKRKRSAANMLHSHSPHANDNRARIGITRVRCRSCRASTHSPSPPSAVPTPSSYIARVFVLCSISVRRCLLSKHKTKSPSRSFAQFGFGLWALAGGYDPARTCNQSITHTSTTRRAASSIHPIHFFFFFFFFFCSELAIRWGDAEWRTGEQIMSAALLRYAEPSLSTR